MSMSDDVSGAVVGISSQVAQKGVESAQHVVDKTVDNIAKLLQVMFKKGDVSRKEKDVKSSDMTDIESGEVGIKELVTDAKKNGDSVVSTDGYSKSDMKFIKKKAAEYGIPIAFTCKKAKTRAAVRRASPDGRLLDENADNICGHVRESDKPIFERICTEMMTDKLKVRPQELENFKAERWEVDGIQWELSKHDLNANWGKTKDGEYFCLFEKADKKAVLMARDSFVSKCSEVENDLTIVKGEEYGMFVFKDEKCGKEISFNDIPSRSELSEMLQDKFGYDENKAEIACCKFGEKQLDGDTKRKFFADNPRKEFTDIQNHIELRGENILVKDYDCLRLTPKTDEVPRLVFRDVNNNFAVLNPEKMSRKEMSEVIRNSLGIEDEKTVVALIDKVEGVNDYYVKQNNENFTHTTTNIDRLDKDAFEVSETNREQRLILSFSDKKNALLELQKMYKSQGLSDSDSKQMAKDVFTKAKSQSPEKVLHIEEVKANNHAANMTVKHGNQIEEIDITERDKAVEELGEKFGVTEDEAETLLEKADEKLNSDVADKEKSVTDEKADKPEKSKANGHEKNPAEKIDLADKKEVKADIPEVPVAPRRK